LTRIEHRDGIAPAIALLPLSLRFAALRLETIPSKIRSDLLRISFFIVWEFSHARTKGVALFPETAFQGEKKTVFPLRSQNSSFPVFLKMYWSSESVRLPKGSQEMPANPNIGMMNRHMMDWVSLFTSNGRSGLYLFVF
jgi:hypothetical protein